MTAAADDLTLALALRSQALGKGITGEELMEWLGKIGKTVPEYLAICASSMALSEAWEEAPIPDEKTDPDGYRSYLKFTLPLGAQKAKTPQS